MRHFKIILRQVRRSSSQAVLFVLCVAMSMAALTAFSGFSQSVDRAMRQEARKLQGADIIIKSNDTFSSAMENALARLTDTGVVGMVRVHEFFSVVRTIDDQDSVLAAMKITAPGYPFYGTVALASGRSFGQVMTVGRCIVAQELLDRLNLKVGDALKIGDRMLTIADVVTIEPDRPINFFSFGPRVFAAAADLEAMGLVTRGSRVRRTILVKVSDAARLTTISQQLKQVALSDQEQVDTYLTAGSRVNRFLNNLFFFLKLVGLFILLMGGIGIQGTIGAMLKEKKQTIAIMKALGATNGYIVRHFTGIVAVLGMLGACTGLLGGVLLQNLLGRMLMTYLPVGLAPGISWPGIVEGLLLGCTVVALFSLMPLQRISQMRPMAIFRPLEGVVFRKWSAVFSTLLILFFCFGVVFWYMQDLSFGFYFVSAMAGLVVIATVATQIMLGWIKRRPSRHLVLRQAAKGLFRPGNATRAVLVTLSASLAVIFGNYLIERNLDATFVQSYPANAPNAFFVDIQPHQTESFVRAINRPVELHPIIRARLTAVNGQTIDQQKERQKRRDNLSRVFNLTYRSHLLADEALVNGKSLFRDDWPNAQVSVLDTVLGMHPLTIGDEISFKIQGVPLKARVSSIRTRTRSTFSPFFYFVFPDEILKTAPHTFFAAVKVPPETLGTLQSRLIRRMPNISVINMHQTIRVFTRLMNQLSAIIRSFSLMSIAVGLLILISSVYATRAERTVESVYYKILGAGRNFIFKVFALENMIIGTFSAVVAMIMAQAVAYWVCKYKLDIDYHMFFMSSSLMIGMVVLLVMIVGLTASHSVIQKRPAVFLRELADE